MKNKPTLFLLLILFMFSYLYVCANADLHQNENFINEICIITTLSAMIVGIITANAKRDKVFVYLTMKQATPQDDFGIDLVPKRSDNNLLPYRELMNANIHLIPEHKSFFGADEVISVTHEIDRITFSKGEEGHTETLSFDVASFFCALRVSGFGYTASQIRDRFRITAEEYDHIINHPTTQNFYKLGRILEMTSFHEIPGCESIRSIYLTKGKILVKHKTGTLDFDDMNSCIKSSIRNNCIM